MWGVVVPLVLVAYFLSAAPVWACVEFLWLNGQVSQNVFEATVGFYTPVRWCANHSEPIQQLLDWEKLKTLEFLYPLYYEWAK